MKYSLYSLLAISLFIFACDSSESSNNKAEKNNMPTPPKASKKEHKFEIHGETVTDDYFWLRLSDEQKSAEAPDDQTNEVVAYLEAENAYTDEVMKETEKLQEELYEEIVGRIKQDDQSVPYFKNGYWYYSRYEEGGDYPLICRKKGSLDAEEQIMLNEPELAKGHDYYAVGARAVSSNNNLLAYAEDTVSRRIYTIKVKNLETGELLDDQITGTSGSVTWANDNKTLFYSKKDPVTLRSFQIYKHTLGKPQSEDELVFEESDDTFISYVYKSKSERFIIIGSSSTVSNEYRVLEADKPDGEFRVIQPRERDLEYSISHFGDHFYITTNLDAKNFRLMKTPVDATTKENWVEVIPHRKDVLLEQIEIFEKFLVVDERKGGLTDLRVIPWEGEGEHYIEFQDPAYSAWIGVNPDFKSEKLRFGYSSLTTPTSTYEYDMNTRERELLKQQEVIGGHNPAAYESERLMATADDGTQIPVSVVYKKGIKKDGSNPLLLYGYGSYGATIDPNFSSTRLSLIDRGFVFAIAHIRGSQTLGREWYEDGKMLNKKNTFTDFIDCAEFLLEENYTSKDKLFAMGGSAGGLLMGAVINMSPDLWKGVVAQVPFVDVVNTMLDESIPLTTGEFDEWGNPKEEKYYHYIKSYSPYDNVVAQDYPNMLVTTGYWDSQVQYWEPAKWVAKLRDLKTDDNLLLLKTDMETGHGGASGRLKRYKEVALEYAFMLMLLEEEKEV
ncbi:S9 family peptidase [Halocola ammonii]